MKVSQSLTCQKEWPAWPPWHLGFTWKSGSYTSQGNFISTPWPDPKMLACRDLNSFWFYVLGPGSGMIQLSWNSIDSCTVANGLTVWSAMWKAIDLVTKDTLFGPSHQGSKFQLHIGLFWLLLWMSMVRVHYLMRRRLESGPWLRLILFLTWRLPMHARLVTCKIVLFVLRWMRSHSTDPCLYLLLEI